MGNLLHNPGPVSQDFCVKTDLTLPPPLEPEALLNARCLRGDTMF